MQSRDELYEILDYHTYEKKIDDLFSKELFMAKKLEGAGLRGQVAGQTSLSTVGKEGHGLTYRGYAIEDLADKAKFEEVS